jgi:hypothetical protein
MKIDSNLFEVISSKQDMVKKRLKEFLNGFDFETKGAYNDGFYVFSQRKQRYGLEKPTKMHHITLKYYPDKFSLHDFKITVIGDIHREEIRRSTTFFGKSVLKKELKLDWAIYQCFPFIARKEDAVFYSGEYPCNHKDVIIDFDELIDIVKRTRFIEEVDFETLYKIQSLVNGIIKESIETVSTIKEELKSELTNIVKNNDGLVEILDVSDLMKLLTLNQAEIIKHDKEYLHKFVRLSNYLKQRGKNIQALYEAIVNEHSISDKRELIGILRNQIHNYELVLFHSLNMVASLCSGNLIEFYEIYESFDKLNIFNSNWENEVSEKLSNIGDQLNELMYSIYSMEQNIVSELNQLSYITSESFNLINTTVSGQLKEIKSSIDTSVLFNGIQAYQLYKINKNTKSLRG